MNDAKLRDDQAASQAIGTLTDYVNGWSPDQLAKVILERLQREHRTLQQSFWSAIKMAIEGYAETEHFDLRNQGAREWAKEVKSLTESPYGRSPGRLPHY